MTFILSQSGTSVPSIGMLIYIGRHSEDNERPNWNCKQKQISKVRYFSTTSVSVRFLFNVVTGETELFDSPNSGRRGEGGRQDPINE